MHYRRLAAAAVLVVMVSACDGDREARVPAAGTPGAGPSAVTATPPPPLTGTVRPAATTARVDGTVDPLGFGGPEPVTLKSNPDPAPGIAVLRGVRIGVHPEEGGWERIVFEFRDHSPAGSIAYVPSVMTCGSGELVPLPGKTVLRVHFEGAMAHDDMGRLTVPSLVIQGPGTTILQARQTCDFEGVVGWALGLSAQQRFKVTRLSNPARLVIDIKQ
jgi:hypothetical protein